MISLISQIKTANKEFDFAKKEAQINERLNKILFRPINYTLIADLKHLKKSFCLVKKSLQSLTSQKKILENK